jgi:hypothetical protein
VAPEPTTTVPELTVGVSAFRTTSLPGHTVDGVPVADDIAGGSTTFTITDEVVAQPAVASVATTVYVYVPLAVGLIVIFCPATVVLMPLPEDGDADHEYV